MSFTKIFNFFKSDGNEVPLRESAIELHPDDDTDTRLAKILFLNTPPGEPVSPVVAEILGLNEDGSEKQIPAA